MNDFCEQLGLAYPIIQAPMAGVSTVALAVAVLEAGALGSYATAAVPVAETVAQQLAELRAATNQPFNINVFCHQPAPPNPIQDAQWLAYLQPFFAALNSTPPPSLEELYPSFLTNDALLAVLVQARPRVMSFHFGLPTTTQLAALRQPALCCWPASPLPPKRVLPKRPAWMCCWLRAWKQAATGAPSIRKSSPAFPLST